MSLESDAPPCADAGPAHHVDDRLGGLPLRHRGARRAQRPTTVYRSRIPLVFKIGRDSVGLWTIESVLRSRVTLCESLELFKVRIGLETTEL